MIERVSGVYSGFLLYFCFNDKIDLTGNYILERGVYLSVSAADIAIKFVSLLGK